MPVKRTLDLPVLALLLLGLPLLGAAVAGFPLGPFFEFPPVSRYRTPAPFAWPAFIGLALFELLLFLPVAALLRGHISALKFPISNFKSTVSRFVFPRPLPPWGWIALLWTATWWAIAWTRLPLVAPVQPHTFTPLWLGFIAVVNAWTFARTGRCMLTHEPRRLLALFAASAGFWWFFEYLNRFVQNWYYEGIADFSALEYALFATPAFATVLPAVLGTADLLESFTPPHALTRCPVRLPPATRGGAWALLLIACTGLTGIGIWPDYFYPLLWLAPLFLFTAFRRLRDEPSLFASAGGGDWRRIALLMTAALVCGFFWEMWNFWSHARWVYQVPFVGRFHLFEMPALGFAGYLPFGLECAVIADALTRHRLNRSHHA